MMWMTARRFDWSLRTRGPAVVAWPATERDAALRLLRRSAAARRLLADALALEDGFGPDPAADHVADDVALGRMRGVVRRALSPPPPVLRGMRWGVIAACIAAGLYLGLPLADPDWSSELGQAMQFTSSATVLASVDE